MIQNMHDEDKKRRADNKYRSEEMSSVINRSLRNAYHDEQNAAGNYLNKHKKFLDKGKEAVRREQNKTFFS